MTIHDAWQVLDAHVSAGLPLYGVVVDRLGEPPAARRYRSDDRENVYSGAKTFTSLAVGIACDRGLLGLDDCVLDHLPQYAATAAEGVEALTVRHLLTMTSGNEFGLFTPEQKRSDDIARAFLAAPLKHPPGSRFEYSSGCSYMLGRLVERVSGRTLRDFAVEALFAPLDIWNPLWATCPRGHTWGGAGLHLTTGEFARVGGLLLREGEWQGRRLVSQAWVRAMHAERVDSSVWTDDPEGTGYGLHVWHCSYPGAYRADGRYGQHSVVVPDRGLAITVTAHHEGDANETLGVLWDAVLPALEA